MDAFAVCLVLLLAMAAHSDATYCVCSSSMSDSVLQKDIDYACGAGADCSAILQNGSCYNPNTVRDHCNYAVNSYYQRKGQAPDTCDFQGTASVTQTPPNAAAGCVYQSSPSGGGSTTPPGPITGGTPPSTGNTPPSTIPGTFSPPGFGLGPTGSGFGNTDSSSGVTQLSQSSTFRLVFLSLNLLISSLVMPRI